MSDQQVALRAAQNAVKHAQRMERAGLPDDADDYWDEAERQYRAAGVDPVWFDDAGLVDALDETPAKMDLYWLYPSRDVELTYAPGDEDVCGIVADVEDLQSIDP